MSMFIGEYQHNLDVKGRMAVPAKFRGKLGMGAIITRGLDKCLFIFAAKEWDALAAKINSLPLSQANSRAFSRFIMSGATDVEFDAQGRILIPENLRKHANLTKSVMIAGVFSRIEVWNETMWKDYKNRTENSSEEIAEKLEGFGI